MAEPKKQNVILDGSGNEIKQAPKDPTQYVNFACEFGVDIKRMVELDYTTFRDETRANLEQMSHMILEQVLAFRKKALAAKGRDVALAEAGEPRPN